MNAAPLPLNLTEDEYRQRAWLSNDIRYLQLASLPVGSLEHSQLQTKLKLQEQEQHDK